MRGTLTSSSLQSSEPEAEKVNENDPKHLRKVIMDLIDKSKAIITTLDQTVTKLQKTERERDYWKQSYFKFRQACYKYVDAEGIQHFSDLVSLEQQLKKIEIEKQCRVEESQTKVSMEFSAPQTAKRKQKIHKSISTVSFSRQAASQHKLGPKKIEIFRTKLKKDNRF